jgi:cytochrome c peroxidase
MKRQLQTELDRDMIISHIKRLDLKKSYSVEVTEKRVKRTISQNSLYWLWLTCIEFETGNNRMDLHEFFKTKYITPEIKNIFGTPVEVRTTTDLNTIQFKYLLDQVQIFASTELSITLPDPEDKKWEAFYKYYSDKL